VLWVAPWRHRNRKEASEVVVHHLAVDDGTADRTTTWALPSGVTRGFGPGDVVEIRVRRWSRRVTQLAVAHSRHEHLAHAAPATVPAGPTATSAAAGPPIGAGAVVLAPLTPLARAPRPTLPAMAGDELGDRLGVSLAAPRPAPGGGASAWLYPLTATPGDAVLLSVGSGRADHLVLGLHRSGEPLPGLGDEAYTSAHGAVARAGEVVARVVAPTEAAVPAPALLGVLAAVLAGPVAARRPEPAGDRPGGPPDGLPGRPLG
jgi:hypothetical protein